MGTFHLSMRRGPMPRREGRATMPRSTTQPEPEAVDTASEEAHEQDGETDGEQPDRLKRFKLAKLNRPTRTRVSKTAVAADTIADAAEAFEETDPPRSGSTLFYVPEEEYATQGIASTAGNNCRNGAADLLGIERGYITSSAQQVEDGVWQYGLYRNATPKEDRSVTDA